MKINRLEVYNKYAGHCAYCGKEITIRQMQVDHAFPKRLAHFYPNLNIDRMENLNPACHKCNNFKAGEPVDGVEWYSNSYREQLGKQVQRLMKNSQFQRALTFGQIKITESPIIFYYEKLGRVPAPQTAGEA